MNSPLTPSPTNSVPIISTTTTAVNVQSAVLPSLAQSNEASLLPGVNILLQGEAGTGKTHSLGTLADTGVELFCLFTEAGLETLLGYWTDRGLPIPPNVHWHVLERPQGSFTMLADAAKVISDYTQDALHKLPDANKAKYKQYEGMLRALANFPDDRTGQKFGAVDSWGPNRCLALDSLTGINPIAMSLVVGGKAVKSQADWGLAMDQIEKLIRQLTDGCKCHFVLTAHVERETDLVFGGVKVTVSTLGSKLAPKIPPMFSDVVLATRTADKFSWSTANPLAVLKARNLPLADGIEPNFKLVFEKWKSRGGRLTEGVKK
jgi:hypothetical protein